MRFSTINMNPCQLEFYKNRYFSPGSSINYETITNRAWVLPMHITMYGLKLRMLHYGCLCDVWCCVYYSNIDNNIIPNCWYILATKERLRKKIISAAKTKLDETTPKDVVFATAVCCGLSSLPGMYINWIKLMLKLFMKFATSLYYSIDWCWDHIIFY